MKRNAETVVILLLATHRSVSVALLLRPVDHSLAGGLSRRFTLKTK